MTTSRAVLELRAVVSLASSVGAHAHTQSRHRFNPGSRSCQGSNLDGWTMDAGSTSHLPSFPHIPWCRYLQCTATMRTYVTFVEVTSSSSVTFTHVVLSQPGHHGEVTGPTDGRHGIAVPGLCAHLPHDETNGPLFLPRQPQWRRGSPTELPNVICATSSHN